MAAGRRRAGHANGGVLGRSRKPARRGNDPGGREQQRHGGEKHGAAQRLGKTRQAAARGRKRRAADCALFVLEQLSQLSAEPYERRRVLWRARRAKLRGAQREDTVVLLGVIGLCNSSAGCGGASTVRWLCTTGGAACGATKFTLTGAGGFSAICRRSWRLSKKSPWSWGVNHR